MEQPRAAAYSDMVAIHAVRQNALKESLMLRKTNPTLILLAALLFAGGPVIAQDIPPPAKAAGKKFSAGIEFNDNASAEETGLPVYPGSRRERDDVRHADSVNLGLWGGDFGVKLVVVKMESSDSPERVAAFYQDELARFGPVVDCSRGAPPPVPRDKRSGTRALGCDKDRGEKNGRLFKAGTRRNQHIVSIQPRDSGSAYQLIHVEVRGLD